MAGTARTMDAAKRANAHCLIDSESNGLTSGTPQLMFRRFFTIVKRIEGHSAGGTY
jgi:hypothetical protein